MAKKEIKPQKIKEPKSLLLEERIQTAEGWRRSHRKQAASPKVKVEGKKAA